MQHASLTGFTDKNSLTECYDDLTCLFVLAYLCCTAINQHHGLL